MLHQPFAIPSLVIALLAMPLVLQLIPRNRFYGYRTAKTLSSDAMWYAANQKMGIAFLLCLPLYAVVAILWPYDPHLSSRLRWLLHLAAFVFPILMALSGVSRSLRRDPSEN